MTEHPRFPGETAATTAANYQKMIESVTDYAIFMLDPEGHVMTWNAGAERLKGYTADKAIGLHFSRFYTEKDVREGRPGLLMERARRDGRVTDEGWRVRKDGKRFWALVVLTSLRDQDGRLIGFTKVTRDLTERKEMEDALREAKASLEEKVAERTAALAETNRELEQFAFIASHDLQEPIRKILMYSDRLRNEDGFSSRQLELLDKVLNAGYRLRSIVQDLLQFSRLTQTPPARENFNLREAVTEALADLELQISESHATLDIGDLPDIYANRSQIRHVFQNLLSNAVKFRRPGVAPHIEITAGQPHNGRVRVCVADNGIGFDEQYKSKIFLPFQRLHQRSQYAGTGMGLSIVQKIVTQHGGAVDVTSDPGRGTTFFVDLPLAAEPAKVPSRG